MERTIMKKLDSLKKVKSKYDEMDEEEKAADDLYSTLSNSILRQGPALDRRSGWQTLTQINLLLWLF